ncbi:MAG: GldG family protein [Defluviitaleaceae bacterium]|nr:GldG family protein [Defluviitaleaceae bacterium]
MKRFLDSFKNKKFRYGAFSTFIALFVIAILVMVVVVFDQLNFRIDMTETGFYTLTDRSLEFIGNLDEDIQIFTLYPTGEEQNLFAEILNQYQANSRNITITNRDPFIHRAFIDQFAEEGQQITPNSIIVVSEQRHRVIPHSDLITFQFNQQTWQNEAVALNIEPRVTNAIAFVIAEDTYRIYQLEGSGHVPVPSEFIDALEFSNFSHGVVDLTFEDVPEDADIIIITTPQRDINPTETQKLIEFLELGGRIFFAIDIVPFAMPNLESVLEAYGIGLSGYYIHEGNPARHYPQFNRWIAPLMHQEHFITRSIIEMDGNFNPMLIDGQALQPLEMARAFLNIDPLLMSTPQSWGRNNPEATSLNHEEGEPIGPFIMAASVTDQFSIGQEFIETRIVAVGTSNLFDSTATMLVRGVNIDFFINSLNWLVDRTEVDTLFIPPRSLQTTQALFMNASQQNNVMMFSLAVVPGILAVAGLVVWLRRRNR